MPVSFKQIISDTAQVTVPVGEETVTATYYPGKITENQLTKLQGFTDITTDSEAIAGFGTLNDMLVTLIKSWDVYEDDEQTIMYPLNAERLKELPIFLRTRILQAIITDIRPEAVASQIPT